MCNNGCRKIVKFYFAVLCQVATLLGVATFITYLAYGVNKKVYQNEYAVVQNKFTTKVWGPLDQGTYNSLTIGDKMFKYTATIQFVDEDVLCITNDGLMITLDINIQLQLNRNEIIPIVWYEFNDNDMFMDFVSKTIYGTLYEDCAYFKASEYYSMRNIIENRMYNSVIDKFNNHTSGITIYNVQLKNIIFPTPFVNIISSKQHLVQEIQTQYNNRTTQLINANSTLIQAEQQGQILIINANNRKNLILAQANATKQNIFVKYEKFGEYYYNAKTKFNFNASSLIKYIYAEYVKIGQIYAAA